MYLRIYRNNGNYANQLSLVSSLGWDLGLQHEKKDIQLTRGESLYDFGEYQKILVNK